MNSPGAPVWATLSERERQVVRLSAEGHTDAAVGERLGLAAETVRSHWKRVRKRLGDLSRAEVIRLLAHEEGNPYREIFEWLHAPVLYGDQDGHYLDVNPAFLELFGYSRDEMLGRHLQTFLPSGTEARFAEAWAHFLSTNQWEGHFPMVRKDGIVLQIYWRSRRAPHSGRMVSIAFEQ